MGRSVSYPSGTICSAYRDVSAFGYDCESDEIDYHLAELDWEDLLEDIVSDAIKQWPSMTDVRSENRWAGREDRILCENELGQIGISEYNGVANIWLRSRKDDYCDYYDDQQKLINLCDSWCNRISEKFEKKFAEMHRIGGFSDGTSLYLRA